MVLTNILKGTGLALAGMAFAVLSMVVLSSSTVEAAAPDTHEIWIPVSTIIRADEGSVTELESIDVDEESQGWTCTVDASAENQGSVHPGNDLVVSSGNQSVTLEDVEREGFVWTTANGELTLGEKITVSLVMGEDEVFSAGMDVKLTCECPPEEVEIEVCRHGKIITIPESERRKTDTNPPCPEKMIEVCRDGKIITIPKSEKLPTDEKECHDHIQVCRDGVLVWIDEGDRWETDTDECPAPKTVEVCRNGEVITVNVDEVLPSDTESCEVLGEKKELPNTGAGSLMTLFGTTTFASAAYGYIKSKRS